MTRIIHRNVTPVTIPATLGIAGDVVTLQNPSDMYLGRKAWHCDFAMVASNGREYWGTIFRSGDVVIYTRDSRTGLGRQLPESHKVAWRKALLAMGRRYILAAIETETAPVSAAAPATVETAPTDATVQTLQFRESNSERLIVAIHCSDTIQNYLRNKGEAATRAAMEAEAMELNGSTLTVWC